MDAKPTQSKKKEDKSNLQKGSKYRKKTFFSSEKVEKGGVGKIGWVDSAKG